MSVAPSASQLPDGVTDSTYFPEPGRLGNLTEGQLHALEKIRKELHEEGVFVPQRMDDASLLRFLRARKFDVAKAKDMLLDAEKWRNEFGVDEIVKNFEFKEKVVVDKYYPQYYHKTDKDGRPVYIEQFGSLDVKALFAETTTERLVKYHVLRYEDFLNDRLPACIKACGHPVETSCTMLDLGNVPLSSFFRLKDYVMRVTSIGQDRYPETMGKFYIINVPWAFTTVWAVIKPWLDEATVQKIEIFGSSYKDTLLHQIPVENLPKEFGGTCECVGGCPRSDAGPWSL